MTIDAPEPRYEPLSRPFRADPLPLHHPAPPMRQRGAPTAGITRLAGAFPRVGHEPCAPRSRTPTCRACRPTRQAVERL
jgi:hypothetical protein